MNGLKEEMGNRIILTLSSTFSDREAKQRYFAAYNALKKYSLTEKIDSMNVLDVGCGSGYFLSFFQEKKDSLFINIDIDKGVLPINNHPFICGDSYNLPFHDNSLDFVVCLDMIEHIATAEERNRIISNLARVTKSGGYIILSTPNKYSQRGTLQKIRNFSYKLIGREISQRTMIHPFPFLSIGDLKTMFEKNKMEIVEVKGVVFIHFVLSYFPSFLRKVLSKDELLIINFQNYIDNLFSKTPIKNWYSTILIIAKKLVE